MTTDQWIAASSVTAVLVAALAIVVSMQHVRDQLRTFIFLVYTDRYRRVMAGVPPEARVPALNRRLTDLPANDREQLISAFRDYFNMCSEEMWLKSNGRVDSDTWKVWRAGMKDVLRSPMVRDVWHELNGEYAYFHRFARFMDGLMSEVERETQTPAKGPSQADPPRSA